MYSARQRGVALLHGVFCHAAFAAGIASMMLGLYSGLAFGRGALRGFAALAVDALLVLQFVVLHSFLLSARGRALLARLVPLGIGRELGTTSFAAISSLQLLLVFVAWSPLGPVWWEAHGALLVVMSVAYALSWGLLLKAMADAGLAVQTGFLGWGAVVRDRAPHYGDFPSRGLFRFVRQPIYLAFALTLWTGPVWTPDHLLLAIVWTLYCVAGPVLKERRYRAVYGDRFQRYRELVPYWVPALRSFDARLLDS